MILHHVDKTDCIRARINDCDAGLSLSANLRQARLNWIEWSGIEPFPRSLGKKAVEKTLEKKRRKASRSVSSRHRSPGEDPTQTLPVILLEVALLFQIITTSFPSVCLCFLKQVSESSLYQGQPCLFLARTGFFVVLVGVHEKGR